MEELDVRIIRLEPMRVASALGFGASPEIEAWGLLLDWAKSQDLLDEIGAHRFFGFNNPNPSPSSPNYGYEQWITIGPEIGEDAAAGGQVEIKTFPGGRFAVTHCQGPSHLGETWKALVAWQEDSPHQMTDNACLEEMLNPQLMLNLGEEFDFEELLFDLYLPLAG
jgi:AraC family transcriptional regulator